jgi:hypothetical protein
LSSDKGDILGTDKVGYKSIHIVASFTNDRLQLIEYSKFKDLKFEIQIRTVLQHAWAQIGHDRKYKSRNELPPKITRGFSLLAGLLEIADNEFGMIINQIEKYSEEVSESTETGNFDIKIDTISLKEYLKNKFKEFPNIDPVFGPNDDMGGEAIEELKILGIVKLSSLNDIILESYINYLKEHNGYFSNFLGVIRDILIINNADMYFEKAWKRKWGIDAKREYIYQDFGIDINQLVKKYGV